MKIAASSLPASSLAASSLRSLAPALMTAAAPKQSHLIWDPGFGPKFAGTAVLLAALALGASRSTTAWLHGMELQSRLVFAMQSVAHRFELWSLLGLLSSSCCALQLLLNAFSFGCAGFNTYLGPLRPFLMALTFFLQGCVWHSALTGRGPRLILNAVGGSVVCLVLTMLPEGLDLYVRRRGGAASAPTTEAPEAPAAPAPTLCLKVSGMGCTACTAKVQAALEQVDGVAACAVDLAAGSATITLDDAASKSSAAAAEAPDAVQHGVESRARAAIAAAGFGAGE